MKSTHSEEYGRLLTALIAARKDRRIPQVDLAKSLGKPQSFVSKYEGRERRLDMAEFLAVCRALGANPLDILGHAGLISAADLRAISALPQL